MEQLKPDKNEMIEAITRSGYLLESMVSKYLSEAGFFVESSQVIIDPFTGKSREIDLVAEYHHWKLNKRHEHKCISKIKFVFEIKNNSAPIVLLTQFEHSPNIEDWLGLKERQTFPEEMPEKYFNGYWDELIDTNRGKIFTQYCSFQRKKANSELMALHPDNIHIGLSKISQYCEESIETWGRESLEKKNGYFRNFIHLPVILISEDLFEMKYDQNGKTELKQVEQSLLVHNYHYKGEPSMAFVYVVTKKGFDKFISNMLKIEQKIEADMIEFRKNTVA